MPDEPKQDDYRVQAGHLYRLSRQSRGSVTGESLALSSIAASLVRIGDLLEREVAQREGVWGPPLFGIQQAGPPEEEKKWYIAKDGRGSAYPTTNAAEASYGPFTGKEVDKRLDEMGIG